MTAMQANERTLSRRVANEGRLVEETTFLVDPSTHHHEPKVRPLEAVASKGQNIS